MRTDYEIVEVKCGYLWLYLLLLTLGVTVLAHVPGTWTLDPDSLRLLGDIVPRDGFYMRQ